MHSPDCALFGSLLSGAGPVIGQLLDDIVPILTSCLSPDTDPEMRLRYVLNDAFISATLQWELQCIHRLSMDAEYCISRCYIGSC